MVLEATLICFDNSDFSRNGDCQPTRFEAQQDATNIICGQKQAQNPESSTGVLTMAGTRVNVNVSPTQDLGKILQTLHDVEVGGECDLVRSLHTAQLVLKHRVNKSQKQRVVLFVASPIRIEEDQLVLLGKRLKKNNVALDIISIGDIDVNHVKVVALFNAVNSSDNSHLLEFIPGSGLLSDVVMRSPILRGEGAPNLEYPPVPTSGEGGDEFPDLGVDATTDPELFMALRISLEEERARQRAAAATTETTEAPGGQTAEAPEPTDAGVAPVAVVEPDRARQPTAQEIEAMEDIDDELKQALLLSLQDDNSNAPSEAPATTVSGPPQTELEMLISKLPGVDSQNPDLQMALRAAERRQPMEEAEQDAEKEEEEKEEKETESKSIDEADEKRNS